jgi:hypothetical protein
MWNGVVNAWVTMASAGGRRSAYSTIKASPSRRAATISAP